MRTWRAPHARTGSQGRRVTACSALAVSGSGRQRAANVTPIVQLTTGLSDSQWPPWAGWRCPTLKCPRWRCQAGCPLSPALCPRGLNPQRSGALQQPRFQSLRTCLDASKTLAARAVYASCAVYVSCALLGPPGLDARAWRAPQAPQGSLGDLLCARCRRGSGRQSAADVTPIVQLTRGLSGSPWPQPTLTWSSQMPPRHRCMQATPTMNC